MASSDDPSLPPISSNALSFLGIREKDLPYAGKLNSQYTKRVSPGTVPFQLTGRADEDGSQIMSNLTGVKSVLDCVGTMAAKKNERNRAIHTHARKQGCVALAKTLHAGCCTYQGGPEKVGINSGGELKVALGPVEAGPVHIEKALDTCDLSFWTCMILQDGKSKQEEEGFSDADSEELEQKAAIEKATSQELGVVDDHGKVYECSKRDEYHARLKESMGFVRMRTQMLQDLSLGDVAKNESLMLAEGSQDNQGSDTSFMSGTSVIVKHARRLAGLMHTEEQAVCLQDLYQFLQNMGKSLGEDVLGASPKSSFHNQLDHLKSLNVVKDLYGATHESKLTTGTIHLFELLRQVEHDVRDRLANLYQGKNFILSRQADFLAKTKSGSEAANTKEETLHTTMERLQKMEDAYEILGTTILDSLKETKKMEEDFHMLQSELVASGCPLLTIDQKKKKSKKSVHKGKKKVGYSENDSINTGSSQSEASSAMSSSRLTSAQFEGNSGKKNDPNGQEQFPNHKSTNRNNLQTDSLSTNSETYGQDDSKTHKKNRSRTHKNEKQKEVGKEGEKDDTNPESVGKGQATVPVQEITPSTSFGELVVVEVTPVGVATAEEKAEIPTSATLGMDLNKHNGLGENVVATIVEDVHAENGEKSASSNTKVMLVDDRVGSSELPQSSKGEDDLFGVENKLPLHETTLSSRDGREIKPCDSASLQVMGKSKRKSHRLSSEGSKDEIVQTDNVAILSLEGGLGDALRFHEYQATDVKELLENMKKMQKQLQFWRTKNWAEKHSGQGQMMPAPAYSSIIQFTKVDASPDMGLVFYYNPRTGIHMMKNVSDLSPSMQQSILDLAAEPGHGKITLQDGESIAQRAPGIVL